MIRFTRRLRRRAEPSPTIDVSAERSVETGPLAYDAKGASSVRVRTGLRRSICLNEPEIRRFSGRTFSFRRAGEIVPARYASAFTVKRQNHNI